MFLWTAVNHLSYIHSASHSVIQIHHWSPIAPHLSSPPCSAQICVHFPSILAALSWSSCACELGYLSSLYCSLRTWLSQSSQESPLGPVSLSTPLFPLLNVSASTTVVLLPYLWSVGFRWLAKSSWRHRPYFLVSPAASSLWRGRLCMLSSQYDQEHARWITGQITRTIEHPFRKSLPLFPEHSQWSSPADFSVCSWEGEYGLKKEIDERQKIMSRGLPVYTVKKPQVCYS